MGKNLKFSDLAAERARINAQAAQMEQSFITSFLHPERVVLGAGSRLLRKAGLSDRLLALIPSGGQSNSFISNLLRDAVRHSSGLMGFLGRALTLVNNPIVSALIVRNRKVWMKWQVINVAFIIIGFFLKKRNTKAS